VESSYNLSFTLVWSRHYSNSQEAKKIYSYWIALISCFNVLLAEKKLAGHKNSKCVSTTNNNVTIIYHQAKPGVTDIFHESRIMVN
jgi:hypothetical protein